MGRLWTPGQEPTAHHADEISLRLATNKQFAENWIEETIQPDIDAGLTDDNFVTPPQEQVSKDHIRALNSKGIRVYHGGGNFFLVDCKQKNPHIIQRRPLAQRYIELEAI